MSDKSYILYLETLVEGFLAERGHDGDLVWVNVYGGSPGTYSIYNIREAIAQKRAERDI